jgi:hypothetical protein
MFLAQQHACCWCSKLMACTLLQLLLHTALLEEHNAVLLKLEHISAAVEQAAPWLLRSC